MLGGDILIILILSLIIVGLAVLERIVYVKKNLDKLRLFIGILITCLFFIISYLVTDTAIGVFMYF